MTIESLYEILKKDERITENHKKVFYCLFKESKDQCYVKYTDNKRIIEELDLEVNEFDNILHDLILYGYLIIDENDEIHGNINYNSITFENLLKLQSQAIEFTKNSKSPYNSISKQMFVPITDMESEIDDYIFNKENWNGGDDIIRQFTSHFEYENLYMKIPYIKSGIEFYYHREMDDKSLSIILDGDIYTMVWYKDRGNTENILFNGRPMDMKEYLYLLNELQNRGVFKFDLNTWNIEKLK